MEVFAMQFKKFLLTAVLALLGASFVQDASALLTGGSVGTPRKTGFADLQLYCDLSDPRSNLVIDAGPSNAHPNVRPYFKLSGQMVCAEVDINDTTPTLGEAIKFVTGPKAGQKAIGLFQLDQITDPALFPGMTFSGPMGPSDWGPGDGTRTWSFDVTGHDAAFPFAQLLWELKPIDDMANAFCNPNYLGVTGQRANLDPNNCKALYGLRLPADATDYPAGRIVNGITLGAGQVFTFSTITAGGVEKTQPLAWAPCHTQRFVGPKEFDVTALDYSTKISGGSVTGSPLDTMIQTGSDPLYVMVQPNDLWNSGPLLTQGGYRFSNADGQTTDVISTAPFKANSDLYLNQLDSDVADYCTNYPSECPAGIPNNLGGRNDTATGDSYKFHIGALVGRLNTDYFLLGTHGTVPNPTSTSNLELFYWDTTTPDNTGSVHVAIATDSIQCETQGGQSIVPTSTIRTANSVNVVSQSTLNVQNKTTTSNFPVTVVGCNTYDPPFVIQPDGSPIVDGSTKILVNGTEVGFTGFSVADTISSPTCDNGQPIPYGLPDLKLNLNQNDVIGVLAPGGKCTNGNDVVRLEVGSDTNGWYSGNFTVRLNKCK
jgi:hypothetical protein